MRVEWVGVNVGEIDYDDYVDGHFGDNGGDGVEKGLGKDIAEEEHVVDVEKEGGCFFGWKVEAVVDGGAGEGG